MFFFNDFVRQSDHRKPYNKILHCIEKKNTTSVTFRAKEKKTIININAFQLIQEDTDC